MSRQNGVWPNTNQPGRCVNAAGRADEVAVLNELSDAIGAPVRQEVPLAEHTTIRIGGPARYLCVARTTEQLGRAMKAASDLGLGLQVLGGGSNVLFSDSGFDGLVLVVGPGRVELDGVRMWAEAGAPYADLVRLAARKGLAGLSFAAGIPGTVGGALWGNAGAYGKAIGDLLVGAVVVGADGRRRQVTRDELRLGYRTSALAETGEVVESVTLELEPGEPQAIWAEVEGNLRRRRERLPGPELPSAGSFFKNLPPPAPGESRVPAGKLLDECGCKGLRVGDAMVYERHANVIVNVGRATAAQVLQLAREMRRRVRERFGVALEPEVRILPAWQA